MPGNNVQGFPPIVKAAVYKKDSSGADIPVNQNANGVLFMVDETSRQAILKLESLNNQIAALTGGKVYLEKLEHTESSKRRTVGAENIQLHVGILQANSDETKTTYIATDTHSLDLSVLRAELIANSSAVDKEQQADKIIAELKAALPNVQSMHGVVFGDVPGSSSETSPLPKRRAWIEMHNPEPQNDPILKGNEKSTSILASGTFADARFVQAADTGDIKVQREVGVDFGTISGDVKAKVLEDAKAETKIALELGRLHGVIKRDSKTTKSGHYGKQTTKFSTIIDYVGTELFEVLKSNSMYANQTDAAKNVKKFAEAAASVSKDLKRMHDRNVIHLDIKPENIGMDDVGEMRLFDFSFSRKIEKGKDYVIEIVQGTPEFLDPDIYKQGRTSPQKLPENNIGVKYTKAVDIFALSQTLIDMLPPGAFKVTKRTLGMYARKPQLTQLTMNPEYFKDAPEAAKEFDKLITLINKCTDSDPKVRPTVDKLVLAFEKSAQALEKTVEQNANATLKAQSSGASSALKAGARRPLNETAQDVLGAMISRFKANQNSYENKHLTSQSPSTQERKDNIQFVIDNIATKLRDDIKAAKTDGEVLHKVEEAIQQFDQKFPTISNSANPRQIYQPMMYDFKKGLEDLASNLRMATGVSAGTQDVASTSKAKPQVSGAINVEGFKRLPKYAQTALADVQGHFNEFKKSMAKEKSPSPGATAMLLMFTEMEAKLYTACTASNSKPDLIEKNLAGVVDYFEKQLSQSDSSHTYVHMSAQMPPHKQVGMALIENLRKVHTEYKKALDADSSLKVRVQ